MSTSRASKNVQKYGHKLGKISMAEYRKKLYNTIGKMNSQGKITGNVELWAKASSRLEKKYQRSLK